MTPKEVFDAVKAEFDEEVAVNVVAIQSVQLSMKIKRKELLQMGLFSARLQKKARKLLWQASEEAFELAFKVAMAMYDYETRKSLAGLGGCTVATIKELIAEPTMFKVVWNSGRPTKYCATEAEVWAELGKSGGGYSVYDPDGTLSEKFIPF